MDVPDATGTPPTDPAPDRDPAGALIATIEDAWRTADLTRLATRRHAHLPAGAAGTTTAAPIRAGAAAIAVFLTVMPAGVRRLFVPATSDTTVIHRP